MKYSDIPKTAPDADFEGACIRKLILFLPFKYPLQDHLQVEALIMIEARNN